jgi:hypothetical protein
MPSADFCHLSRTFPVRVTKLLRRWQISPGKNVIFLSIYPPHLLAAAFDSKDFALYCKLIQLPPASPGVRGPRAEDLPLASFRFCVTTDTLALS